jgi:hypothetical protein
MLAGFSTTRPGIAGEIRSEDSRPGHLTGVPYIDPMLQFFYPKLMIDHECGGCHDQ